MRAAHDLRWALPLLLALLPTAGVAATLERLVMPGPVASYHAELEDSCESCHSPLDQKPQETLCVACHEGVAEDLEQGMGFHGRAPEVAAGQCQRCHREHEGREAQTLDFDWSAFNHDHSDFPLRWAHGGLSCESCHAPDSRHNEAPGTCAGCHADDDPHEGGLGDACESCHWERSWEAPLFEHAATGFLLEGGHAAVGCSACHDGPRFQEAEADCVSCHASDDSHGGRFGARCADCHGVTRWSATFFDHSSTGFALTGGHAPLSCESCHGAEPLASLTDAGCMGCHAADDVHEGRNGPLCESCHGTDSWSGSSFQHLERTGFALAGAHDALRCESCHRGSLHEPLPRECRGCHEDVHEGQLVGSCSGCHGAWSWTQAVRFEHGLTHFPLLGRHGQLACAACHASARFHDAGSGCADCHSAEDAHAGSLGDSCGSCHSPLSWRSTVFDHANETGFLLEGAHGSAACQSCHGVPRLLQVESAEQCAACHEPQDVHEGRFGRHCGSCHGTDSFARVEQL